MKSSIKNVPFFTVVIPTLNEAIALPSLLKDLDAQSYKNFSVIVVDAKSSDSTPEIVTSYQAHSLYSLTLLSTSKKGVSNQRNRGANQSQSPWLIFIDADSRIEPQCLESIHNEVIIHPSTDLFTLRIKPTSNSINEGFCSSLINVSYEVSRLIGHPWCMGAFIAIKHSVFSALDGFDESLTYGEDTALVRKAVKSGYCFNVFNKTKYMFSFRRYHHHGYVKTISRYIELDFEQKFSKKTIYSDQYPMGGQLYNKENTMSKSDWSTPIPTDQ